jgi:triphosphatase
MRGESKPTTERPLAKHAADARSAVALSAPREQSSFAPTRSAAAPTRVQLVRLPRGTRGDHGCSVMLTVHAAAIAHNFDCVLTTLDPEGPHQLRIALRRTRVLLRVFKPLIRRRAYARLATAARGYGAIVGELRDADVLIDEIIAPAAKEHPDLLSALNAWRHETRGRVRAQLRTLGAPAFAAELSQSAVAFDWRRKGVDARAPAARLIVSSLATFWEKAAVSAKRLPDLTRDDLHELRKDVKALRYGAELAGAVVSVAHAELARPLKRMQDALGYANDMAALEQFNPPVLRHRTMLAGFLDRLIAEKAAAVAEGVARAALEWRELERIWPFRRGAAA